MIIASIIYSHIVKIGDPLHQWGRRLQPY